MHRGFRGGTSTEHGQKNRGARSRQRMSEDRFTKKRRRGVAHERRVRLGSPNRCRRCAHIEIRGRASMRVAVIYNRPRPAAPAQCWMSSRTTRGGMLPAGACDIAEFGVLHQVQAVTRALQEGGHQAVVFAVDDVGQLATFLAKDRPDIIFNCCESLNRTAALEMNVAAVYELFAIPFTGSSALTLGLALNKAYAKAVF